MKKVYLCFGLFLLGGSGFAQRTTSEFIFGQPAAGLADNGPLQTRPTSGINNQDRVLNVLWTEDFAGAVALTTGNGLWTTGGPSAAYWSFSSATAHPYFTSEPVTMTGRHMRWDSYPLTPAETGTFAHTTSDGTITSPTIDLSGQTNGAIIEFDVQSMYCCNFEETPWNIYVSENDGVSWSPAIPLDFGVDRNVATENIISPMHYSVDISSYISSTPSTVKVRFAWTGVNADANTQKNTYYYWLLDNISIYEVPAYQVEHQKLWIEDMITRWEHGDIAKSQALPFSVTSQVKSLGLNAPTAFEQEVTIYNDAMVQVHQSSGGTLLNAPLNLGETDSIIFTTAWDPATQPTGTYTVRVVTTYTEADELPDNDTLWRTFEVTDNLMSHFDYDQPFQKTDQGGSTFDPYYIGALFLIENDVDLHGIDFYLGSGTTYDEFEFYVYQAGSSSIDYLAGPFTYAIDGAMLGTTSTFNLHMAQEPFTDLPLLAGEVYYVVASVSGGFEFEYGLNPIDSDNSGRLYIPADDSWYLSGDEPAIALNFDEALTVESNVLPNATIGQNVPNPFGANSIINYTLTEEANVSVEFVDVAGKVVKTVNQGNQAAGSYTLTVDGSDFAEGVYFYTFTIGDNKATKQMVVKK